MKAERIERIPIAKIRVVNPRSRIKKTFQGIIKNIDTVGLKKPITVFRREADKDGTMYDLVCGQGRLEAVAALGATHIPAIITQATLKQRYLMSLIENVARKRPPLSDLLHEIRRLRKAGDANSVIAEKLGMGRTYVDGIVRLIKCGEDRLVEQVEAGTIPLSVAVKIATADSVEIQRAMSEAYEAGELRGSKLFAVQRIIARRTKSEQQGSSLGDLSGRKLAQEYERQTHRQRELITRAVIVRERLALLSTVFKQLVADEHFVNTLKSEGLDSMPNQLVSRLC